MWNLMLLPLQLMAGRLQGEANSAEWQDSALNGESKG